MLALMLTTKRQRPLSPVIEPVAAAFTPHHPDTVVMNAASIICFIDLAS